MLLINQLVGSIVFDHPWRIKVLPPYLPTPTYVPSFCQSLSYVNSSCSLKLNFLSPTHASKSLRPSLLGTHFPSQRKVPASTSHADSRRYVAQVPQCYEKDWQHTSTPQTNPWRMRHSVIMMVTCSFFHSKAGWTYRPNLAGEINIDPGLFGKVTIGGI